MRPHMDITDSAASQIAVLQKQAGGGNACLRITVLGGGCSGFHYEFQMDDTVNPDDFTFEKNGVTVVTDATSMQYLQNAQLDYEKTLLKQAFRIRNPNAGASCGCGNSFSV